MSDTFTLSLQSGPERMAVAFARVLRGVGITTPVDSIITFTNALGVAGIDDRDTVYWAGRSTLIRRPEDIALFNRAFSVFWEQRAVLVEGEEDQIHVTLAVDSDEDDGATEGEAEASNDPVVTLRFSGVETLRHKDFAKYTDEEMSQAQQLMHQLRLVGSPRRSLRQRATRHRGTRPDIRRTVRASLAAGGEPMLRKWIEPGERTRRLVLLLDVSGSMEPYARALVRFVHAAVVGRQRVEAFTLGTRLTRITRELSSRDPDRALKRAGDSVHDWSGGTRLGETLQMFNNSWGVRGMARGAIVVILSDGWDRGAPEALSEQMARLRRVAHKIVWVNPLKVTPGYAPLARGMAAALPYVDDFVEGHSVDALEHLTKVINNA